MGCVEKENGGFDVISKPPLGLMYFVLGVTILFLKRDYEEKSVNKNLL